MTHPIKLVILESPYAGDVEANVAYARQCARDCAMLNESVAASHLLFTQFLDDTKPDERARGIALGLAWRKVADYSVFYIDRGWSSGMLAALDSALAHGKPFYIRALQPRALGLPKEWVETKGSAFRLRLIDAAFVMGRPR